MTDTSHEAKPASQKADPRRSRRASYVVLLAVSMVALLGFTAIVVDVGTLRIADSELEVAVDAAALAGASQLDGTSAGITRAKASAVAVASLNEVRRRQVTLDPAGFEFGVWDATGRTFHASSDVVAIDAMRVTAAIGDVPTPFAGAVFARSAVDVHAMATALRPPPEPAAWSPCFLPIAIPKCIADAMENPGPGTRSFQLANDTEDNVGWAHPVSANANIVGNALYAAATGECAEGEPRFEEGQPANLQNGVAAVQLKLIRDLLMASAQSWDAGAWGGKPAQDPDSMLPGAVYPGAGVLQGPIAVIDEGGVACADVKFNQNSPVDRLAWGVVYDVYSSGTHKGFQLLIDVEHDWTTPGGGSGSGNVNARPPGRLVE